MYDRGLCIGAINLEHGANRNLEHVEFSRRKINEEISTAISVPDSCDISILLPTHQIKGIDQNYIYEILIYFTYKRLTPNVPFCMFNFKIHAQKAKMQKKTMQNNACSISKIVQK